MLKIQKPGTFTRAGQKNSTVLLPSQLVLLTENECSVTARVCVECKGGKNQHGVLNQTCPYLSAATA